MKTSLLVALGAWCLGAVGADLVSTYDPDLFDGQGTAATEAECQARLAADAAEFQAQTALVPKVVRCERDPALDSRFPWFARIEADGSARIRPIAENLPIDVPMEDSTALAARLRAAASAWQPLSHLVVDDTAYGQYRIGLRYYASGHRPFRVHEVGRYRSEARCGETVKATRNMLGGSVKTLGVFCAKEKFTTRLTVTAVTYEDTYGLQVETAPQDYSTLTACEAARAATADSYRAQGRDVLGTLCEGSADLFLVRVLSRYPRPY